MNAGTVSAGEREIAILEEQLEGATTEDERRELRASIRDVERDLGEVERQEELRDSGRGGW